MKKLNGLFALLMILAAIFCLTACPQPADPDPTPAPETPAPVTAATIDYSKYTAPANADSLTWTTIDASFDFTRLANTKWIEIIETDKDTDDGITAEMTEALILSINSDVTDASLTFFITYTLTKDNGSDFTTDEISEISAEFDDEDEDITVEKVTTNPKKLVFAMTQDSGNWSDRISPEMGTFKDSIIGGEIDSSNKYMRSMEHGQYEYLFRM